MRGFYVHAECLAVMLLFECDPTGEYQDEIPLVCARCRPRLLAAQHRRTQFMNLLEGGGRHFGGGES